MVPPEWPLPPATWRRDLHTRRMARLKHARWVTYSTQPRSLRIGPRAWRTTAGHHPQPDNPSHRPVQGITAHGNRPTRSTGTISNWSCDERRRGGHSDTGQHVPVSVWTADEPADWAALTRAGVRPGSTRRPPAGSRPGQHRRLGQGEQCCKWCRTPRGSRGSGTCANTSISGRRDSPAVGEDGMAAGAFREGWCGDSIVTGRPPAAPSATIVTSVTHT